MSSSSSRSSDSSSPSPPARTASSRQAIRGMKSPLERLKHLLRTCWVSETTTDKTGIPKITTTIDENTKQLAKILSALLKFLESPEFDALLMSGGSGTSSSSGSNGNEGRMRDATQGPSSRVIKMENDDSKLDAMSSKVSSGSQTVCCQDHATHEAHPLAMDKELLAASNPLISDMEKRRIVNMQRNQELIRSLDIDAAVESLVSPTVTPRMNFNKSLPSSSGNGTSSSSNGSSTRQAKRPKLDQDIRDCQSQNSTHLHESIIESLSRQLEASNQERIELTKSLQSVINTLAREQTRNAEAKSSLLARINELEKNINGTV